MSLNGLIIHQSDSSGGKWTRASYFPAKEKLEKEFLIVKKIKQLFLCVSSVAHMLFTLDEYISPKAGVNKRRKSTNQMTLVFAKTDGALILMWVMNQYIHTALNAFKVNSTAAPNIRPHYFVLVYPAICKCTRFILSSVHAQTEPLLVVFFFHNLPF